MNNKQKSIRNRIQRRFSGNDGVLVSTGEHKGRAGVVLSCASMDTKDLTAEPFQYVIQFTDASGGTALIEGKNLASDPQGNLGKYGGPSRGGAAGGWVGGNNYR